MMWFKRTKGYLISLRELRHTRLELEKLRKRVVTLSKPATVNSPTKPSPSRPTLDTLHQLSILREIASRQASAPFRPNKAFLECEANRKIATNGFAIDYDGGVNENLKTIFRTSNISQKHVEDSDLSLISVMRPDNEQFWKCIARSYELHLPLYYSETSFFAGFASYFDKSVSPAFKKSLGFIFDDMGYYFDSRSPSRLETNLNDATWSLTDKEHENARSMIDAIVENQITKYNRYVGGIMRSYIPDGIVLVVDQKRNDASIRLGSANNSTFETMLQSAVAENPDKKIYVKTHPDNTFERGGDSYSTGKGWMFVDDDISVSQAMEKADTIYTVSSQVGFEALLRGKRVVTFGIPFYAGWGLTDDRQAMPRRKAQRSIEEVFHQACVELSVYVDPTTGDYTTLANTIDRLLWMRATINR